MIRSSKAWSLLGAALTLSSILCASDARACGGCFHPEDQSPEQTSVVTAHRMALSISTDQTVLWDQVQYAGSPEEFAWVLPVKPGARLEVASDAWLEALEAATAVRVSPPAIQCVTTTQRFEEGEYIDGDQLMHCQMGPAMLGGCAADSEMGSRGEGEYVDETSIETLEPPADPVEVVHQGSAGPYETLTLHSDVEGALTTWLVENGFAIDESVLPIIDDYSADGFDFIVLRLLPDQGVQQMKPVRVIQPGAVPLLPLRMVAAGTGANVALTLFVIGEGRWAVDNFPTVPMPTSLSWDFATNASTFANARSDALAQGDGSAWMTTSARPGGLLAPQQNPVNGSFIQINTAGGVSDTVANAFAQQGYANGETSLSGCRYDDLVNYDEVVDPCKITSDTAEEICEPLGPGQIDVDDLQCGSLDDLGVALLGMHPRDVWLTRVEAFLPRAALDRDLRLSPADQTAIPNWIVASSFENAPCDVAPEGATAARRRSPARDRSAVGMLLLLAGAGVCLRRSRRS
ncbi:MAG: DUF2330 domain-containing protein [Myxococcales bacterium]|nr:DUF2330 domain-containing protein [Myxococcales bacterium]